ncbi:MAG TPA: NHL repeat-containing protein [Alphaproteobacteria bacterium]|nr:NHL repeat-containing protein [Alphaproteobacteria bacterium]
MNARNACSLALWTLVFNTATSVFAQTYSFTTVAGSASQGSNDGSVTNARFFAPQGVTVNAQGIVFVADSDNSAIREIMPNGIVSTIAGQAGSSGYADGTGTNALFFLPRSVVSGPGGNLYVVDTWNEVIRQLTLAGTSWQVSTLAGRAGFAGYTNATGTNAEFDQPGSAAVDAAGNIYVTDSGNDLIRKITPAGVVTTIAGQAGNDISLDGTNGNALFASPNGITIDSQTNLYVTDSDNTIRRMTLAGTNWIVTTIAGQTNSYGSADGLGTNALLWGPEGISADTNGNLYIADSFNKTIRKLTSVGTNWMSSTVAGLPGAQGSTDGTNSVARFGSPFGLAVDTNNDVFVADVNNNNLRKIVISGTNANVTTLAGIAPGSVDGPALDARFWNPTGVAVDSAGNIFVADLYNSTVRRIATNGEVSTIAGLAGSIGSSDGTNSDARFYDPIDVALDKAGNVYVTDIFNNTIRKITPIGTNWIVSTIAGKDEFHPGELDGIGTNAIFYNPTGIAVDANTNLYVTDGNGATIRRITPSGTNWLVTTIAGFPQTFGSTDGVGTNALFFDPHGITVDTESNVYVADTVNDTIRKLSPDGTNWIVTTIAGQAGISGTFDGTGTNALFYFPEGVALDKFGNLYVADSFNDTLRRLSAAGSNWISSTIAGQADVEGYTDGIGASALFYIPQGIALDNGGNLYVADTYNNTVRLGQITALPALQIGYSTGHMTLFWPNTGNYILQTNSNLSLPEWGAFGSTTTTANGTNHVTIISGHGDLFFRLANQ